MREFLKVAAFICKIGAIVFWLGTSWVSLNLDIQNVRATAKPHYRDAPSDWGTAAFYQRTYLAIVETILLTVVALLPNCLLIFSRIAFAVSLFVALTPLSLLFETDFNSSGLGDIISSMLLFSAIVAIFAPLPVSIILSFLRRRRGERVNYA